MKHKKHVALALALAALLVVLTVLPAATEAVKPAVYVLHINETVTAGTAKHISRGLEKAASDGVEAVVIMLNTPGGLVTATLDILQAMSASAVPIITYVSPQGAIAASAGTFILLNGHIAAMSPGTTCGAAMPVTAAAPGEGAQAADQKTINFLAGHMKSIARERGRPADLAEKFVTENLSMDNGEALEKNIVDLNAADMDDLLQKINGMTVKTGTESKILNTSGSIVTDVPMDTRESFIHLISNPTLSMILLLLGIYGLIIGFYSPGLFVPEIIGSISLILGLTGMGLFQGNLGAGLLILLGAGLLIAELFTPTYGILGVGGLASLVLGVLFFPIEPLMPADWFQSFKVMALGVGVIGAIFLVIVVTSLARIRRLDPVHGEAEFQHAAAYVVKRLDPEGLVRFRGEIWQAVSKDGLNIPEEQKVRVIERRGMKLYVSTAVKAAEDKQTEE
ncbi:MAG: nodulation protein NfeD [Desulfotomaculaceae bacterium]|nr:nodulation protein NfeD [Desulfotomaculaceae bacterium]